MASRNIVIKKLKATHVMMSFAVVFSLDFPDFVLNQATQKNT